MTKRRAWRKSLHRTETWKGVRYMVTRNNRGRFVTWHRIRHYRRGVKAQARWKAGVSRGWIGFGGKRIAVWRGNKRVQMVGSGQQLKQAMEYVIKHPPKKQFLTVSAEALLNDPDEYLEEGRWSDRPNIESR